MRKPQGQQLHRDELRRKGLGCSHPDLRTSSRVQHGVGLPCHRRVHHIGHRDESGALSVRVPDRSKGVESFARLGDADDERLSIEHRVAVAELRRNIDLHWKPCPPFDGVFGHHRRVVRGPAGDYEDFVEGSGGLEVEFEFS